MIDMFDDIADLPFDIDRTLLEIERENCEENLYYFLQAGWRYIDPAPFTPGWPIEAVAEHLQAVCDGEIRRLIINIPPRCAKSSLCSVAFPAWVWAQSHRSPTSGPSVPFLHASYAYKLAIRDSVKCRRLIQSPWYQSMWGERFALTAEVNNKERFENDQNGTRLVTSVDAAVTGEGGNIIVIDDPNSAREALSEATIETTKEWWDTTMSTRRNDPKTGAFVIIQQRLAEEDLTGHILSKNEDGWDHLVLPMRYEAERSYYTSIGWKDPRTEEGQLLWPDRFGEKEVVALEKALGPWAAAGQLQQRPEPKGGGIIKRDWWQLWEHDAYPAMDYIVASLDTAYTTKEENDFSALTIWGVFSGDIVAKPASNGERVYDQSHPRVMLMHGWAERLELHDLVKKTFASCTRFKVDKLIIENKAAGISVSQELRRLGTYESFHVQLLDPMGMDKLARLYSVQHLFAEGMVYAPDRQWADQVITQCATFPRGKNDDLVDTVSMAIRHIRQLGLLIRAPEHIHRLDQQRSQYGAGPAPLYPV